MQEIFSISVNAELYLWLQKWIIDNELKTTTFNHGKGVDRIYTFNFCLQSSYFEGKTYYKLTKGGRPLTRTDRHFMTDKEKEKLIKETPDFQWMVDECLKFHPSHVYKVKKREVEPKGFLRPKPAKGILEGLEALKESWK